LFRQPVERRAGYVTQRCLASDRLRNFRQPNGRVNLVESGVPGIVLSASHVAGSTVGCDDRIDRCKSSIDC
jgi:hypothetical protein